MQRDLDTPSSRCTKLQIHWALNALSPRCNNLQLQRCRLRLHGAAKPCTHGKPSLIRSSNTTPECTGNGLNFKLSNLIDEWTIFHPVTCLRLLCTFALKIHWKHAAFIAGFRTAWSCFRGKQFVGLWWADFNKIILWFAWLDFVVSGTASRQVAAWCKRLALFVLGVLCELFVIKRSRRWETWSSYLGLILV